MSDFKKGDRVRARLTGNTGTVSKVDTDSCVWVAWDVGNQTSQIRGFDALEKIECDCDARRAAQAEMVRVTEEYGLPY